MTQKTMTGVVGRINAKPWFDQKKGVDIILYSFTLQGVEGWFRTGTNRPPVAEGSPVRFVVDTRNGQVVQGSIEQAEESEVTHAPRSDANSNRNSNRFPTRSRSSTGTGGSAKDTYWQDKDKYYKEVEVPRITLSACQSRAIEIVKMALANDAVNLGATKNKRLDNLLGVVDEVTNRLIKQINSIGEDGTPETNDAEQPFDDEIPFGDEENNNNWED